jgi:hypothetical protein
MPPSAESSADAALVAVVAEDGQVVGTGFAIDSQGTVLTCHHVVDGLGSIRLLGKNGTIHAVNRGDVVLAPEVDLALIRVPGLNREPLPLAADSDGAAQYWTKGFHRIGDEVRGSFPVQGSIIGRTPISYSVRTDYRFDVVLVLRDDVIEAGLSGAPVLDPATGVVIGVVSAGDQHGLPSGFAIPIELAAAHHALAHDIAANRRTVPAYGRYLNAPAARRLCADVTNSEIQTLASMRGLDLTQRVARTYVEAALRSFLASDAQIFALVGPSGVGKSTELAAFAQRSPHQMLMLRGSSMRPEWTGLGQAIEVTLAKKSGHVLPEAADRAIARALPPGSGLVVVLDGINEAPLTATAFEEWAVSARSWLDETSARLVLSCRPELWDDILGPAFAADLSGHRSLVTKLGKFTEQEFAQAAVSYQLTASLDSPILRLPLALALWASHDRETGSAAGSTAGPAALSDLVEAFVADASRRVARSQPGLPLSAAIVRDLLIQAAAEMWRQDADALDISVLGQLLAAPAIVSSLVTEGVMTSTSVGLRFVYDEVADWLKAQRIEVGAELSRIIDDADISWRRIGPVAAALRDLERRSGPQELAASLQRLVDDCPIEGLGLRLAIVTLGKIVDARPYVDVLTSMARRIVSVVISTEGDGQQLLARLIAINLRADDFWVRAPLPTGQLLRLLREFLPSEHSYPWRPRDWSTWRLSDQLQGLGGGWNFSWRHSVSVADIVAHDPGPGIAELLTWLDDKTGLVDHEATVADVAMGVLYQLRKDLPTDVWLAVARTTRKCFPLITQLADDDPQWLAQMVSGQSPVPGDEELVINSAVALTGKAKVSAEQHQAVRAAVAQRYESGLSAEATGWALNVLSTDPAAVSSLADKIVTGYENRMPGINSYTLVRIAEDGAGAVALPALIAELRSGSDRKLQALMALAHSTDVAISDAADSVVLRQLELGALAIDLDACQYAEQRLYRNAPFGPDLLAIVRRVIGAPPGSGSRLLASPLVGADGLRDGTQRHALLTEFVNASSDSDAHAEVIQRLASSAVDDPERTETIDLMRLVISKLDPELADYLLFRKAIGPKFANVLAQWLTAGKLTPPGPLTRQFLELVEAGSDPPRATNEILQSELKRGSND